MEIMRTHFDVMSKYSCIVVHKRLEKYFSFQHHGKKYSYDRGK